jgi:hypothetical protein
MTSSYDFSPLRARSQSYSFPRQFYPPSVQSFRRSMTPRGLPAIGEDERPHTSAGLNWDTYSLPPGQMSPTFSAAQFSSTSSWFPGTRTKHSLSQKDVIANIHAFETLVATSKQYENALRMVSDASMQFAEALEMFAKCKDLQDEEEEEEEDLVEGFRSLSGYQYYVGSQQRVLAQLVNVQCTTPLETQLEAYRGTLIVLPSFY